MNRHVPRLVDVLPNGPRNHPTVQVYLAGGVPEVMLRLRELDVLDLDVLTVTGDRLGYSPGAVGAVRASSPAAAALQERTASTRRTSS